MLFKLKTSKGFTLVELAIVIVIIGLLVGGVLQGQELIQQAKIRKLHSDFEGYKAAVITFYGKFNAYPGDFNRATSFISSDTYNGSGNQKVEFDNEVFYFWHHLSLSKLIKGSFTGQTAGEAGTHIAKKGINVPLSSSFDGSYWMVTGSNGRNELRFANDHYGDPLNSFPYNSVITPMTAYILDLKYDDGIPTRGIFLAHNGSDAIGECNILTEYMISVNKPTCQARYIAWN